MIISAEVGRLIGLGIMFKLGFLMGWIFGHKKTEAEQIRELINAPKRKD